MHILNQDIANLFLKYLDKKCSVEELETVLSIIEDGTFIQEWDFALSQEANRMLEAEDVYPKRNELSAIKLHHRLMASVSDQKTTIYPKLFRGAWRTVSITAAASLLLFFGWWFFGKPNSASEGINQITYESDVAPGKMGAKLRLKNGKEINLDDSKNGLVVNDDQLTYDDGTALEIAAKPSAGENYTAFTDKGNMYTLTLSDGTQVWLNAGSQLEFPAHFTAQSRKVNLNGEAFFKVAKDASHPFIVESKGQQVKVLGTEFNINSYADEKVTKTTLVAGSIHISGAENGFLLKPGQQATQNAKGQFAITEVDTTMAIAWRNNNFIFGDNDIESVMRTVKRWYNVEVIYSGALPEVTFGGKISRLNNVSSVLRFLENTGGVHFKIQGNKIYVFK